MWAYRGQLQGTRRWLLLFTVPSVAGGIVGAQLLLHTSAARFDAIVPFLVLGATVLFMLQQPLSRRLARRAADEHAVATALPPPSSWLLAGQFGVAVYGGYFGAGIGILMLAAFGIMGFTDIHQMNGLKTFLALCINGVAAGYFIWNGMVSWPHTLVMAVGAIAGGVWGAGMARRIGPKGVRRIVIAVGFTMAFSLLFRL
jgi:hypothetical protein